jgi:formylglycine-generating enzyme required for sulfatase activity
MKLNAASRLHTRGSLFLCLLTSLALMAAPVVRGQFAGGAGSAEDPYLIATAEHLDAIRHHLTAHFRLTADIDLGVAPWNEGTGWEAIGGSSSASRFRGSLDGAGYTLSNLRISRSGTTYQGLFAYLDGAEVRNLRINEAVVEGARYSGILAGYLLGSVVEDVEIVDGQMLGTGADTGGLVGYAQSESRLARVAVEATVQGTTRVGGVIGDLRDSELTDVVFTGTVEASGNYAGGIAGNSQDSSFLRISSQATVTGTVDYVGGLFGQASTSQIDRSTAQATVSGRRYVGGVAGSTSSGVIQRTYFAGEVSASSADSGGLVGYASNTTLTHVGSDATVNGTSSVGGLLGSKNSGTLRLAWSRGSVHGSGSEVGGLVGRRTGTSGTPIIAESYSHAEVSGASSVGGLTGNWSSGVIQRSFSTGSVTGTGSNVGGLNGRGGTVVDGFWDVETSGRSASAGGTGLTTAQMRQQASFEPGFDFANIWQIEEGAGYPEHRDLSGYDFGPLPEVDLADLPGSGTAEDPYLLRTAAELNAMRKDLTAHYRLDADIDLTDSFVWNDFEGWAPVGGFSTANRFRGSFDGAGHTLSNLRVSRSNESYQGLFGYLEGAQVRNLLLEGAVVRGAQHSGLLAGRIHSSVVEDVEILNSQMLGTNADTGGLAGSAESGNQVARVAVEATVRGTGRVGGVIGDLSDSELTDVVFTGLVEGSSDHAGGIAGRSNGSLYQRVSSQSEVSGASYVGGVCGRSSNDSFTEVHAEVVIMGSSNYIGGLFGDASSPRIDRSTAEGTVSGSGLVGGVAGQSSSGVIQRTYFTGEVIASGSSIGGLVGYASHTTLTHVGSDATVNGTSSVGGLLGSKNSGTLRLAWSRGSVHASGSEVGGLVGRTGTSGTPMIAESYSHAAVSGASSVGGLTGNWSSGVIQRSFSTGSVTGTGSNVGGLNGRSGTVVDGFWDVETSGQSTSAGGTGLTTAQMRQQSSFEPGFDFANIWQIEEGVGYPEHRDLSGYDFGPLPDVDLADLPGSGTAEDPYLLRTAAELNAMRKDLTAHYRLDADIDLTDSFVWNDFEGWAPVGGFSTANRFRGSFDGAGHTLGNLRVSRSNESYQGLFGYLEGAQIRNLRLEGAVVRGRQHSGLLAGRIHSSVVEDVEILNSQMLGTNADTGGLAGSAESGNQVARVAVEATVRGTGRVGGVIGDLSDSELTDVVFTGLVEASGDHAGGIAGRSNGSLYQRVSSQSEVSGASYVGGICGRSSNDSFTEVHAEVVIMGSSNYIGGLFGDASSPRIDRSTAEGTVSGSGLVGGVAGQSSSGVIQRTYFTGEVIASGSSIGGLVGYASHTTLTHVGSDATVNGTSSVGGLLGSKNSGTLRLAWSRGSVHASGSEVGGLVGRTGTSGTPMIAESYSHAAVSGASSVGGLTGNWSSGVIQRSFSTGSVTGTGSNVGGLNGRSGTVVDGFWDVETSGQSTSAGGTGLTTAQMWQQTSFEPGFDFANIWQIEEGAGYPEHRDLSGYDFSPLPEVDLADLSGSGTAEDPYLLRTAAELNAMRKDLTAHYLLDADIDLTDSFVWNDFTGWAPVGGFSTANRFRGSFDGAGHTLSNLRLSRSNESYQGLFGYLEGAQVRNLLLEGAVVRGAQHSGLLAGRIHSSVVEDVEILNSQMLGTNADTGGLAGSAESGNQVARVAVEATVRGTGRVGGVIGDLSDSELTDVVFTGLVEGSSDHAGGIAGRSNGSLYQRVSSQSEVSGASYVGGICGRSSNDSFTEVHAEVVIMGSSNYIGGLFGDASSPRIDRSTAEGTVSGSGLVGGVAGQSSSGVIQRTYFTGEVIASGSSIGGLVGYASHTTLTHVGSDATVNGTSSVGGLLGSKSSGTLRLAWSRGSVHGSGSEVGGLVGRRTGTSGTPMIAESYSHAAVSGASSVGGLTGNWSSGVIQRSFSTGSVTGTGSNVGGLNGSGGTVVDGFWDMETSGQSTSAGGTGLTTAQMRQQSSFEPGFDFANIWQIEEGVGYPEHRDLSGYDFGPLPDVDLADLPGSGTAEDPYLLHTAAELNAMRKDLTAHYRLDADIDLTDSFVWNDFAGWAPVGGSSAANRFRGSLDGAGHTLSNLRVSRSNESYQGLFGYLEGAQIRNLRLEGAVVRGARYSGILAGRMVSSVLEDVEIADSQMLGTAGDTGGLAGSAESGNHIARVAVEATVLGTWQVGGVIGDLRDSELTDVVFTGTVEASGSNAGGIVGRSRNSSLLRVSSQAEVMGESYAGGVSGESSGDDLSQAYADGSVLGSGNYVGGLVGHFSSGELRDSFAHAAVSGRRYVGGALGSGGSSAIIDRVYSTGAVEASWTGFGGLAGSFSGSANAAYWNRETAGLDVSAAGESRSTEEMTYPHAVDTFVGWFTDGVWAEDVPPRNNGYPYLVGFPPAFLIEAVILPEGGGMVDGAGAYWRQTAGSLTATPAEGYYFVGWSENGEDLGEDPILPFRSSVDRTLVATFALYEHNVSVSAMPAAGGSVGGDGLYANYSEATVTANPSTGYHFVHWTEDGTVVSTQAVYTFTVTGSRALTAHFALSEYAVSVSAQPPAGGSVGGGGNYTHFSQATVTANPSTGYHFVHWTEGGSVVSTQAVYTFTVTGPRALTAHFAAEDTFLISLASEPGDGGQTSGGGSFSIGQSVTVTAEPSADYHFIHWTEGGSVVSTDAAYSFTVTGARALVAHFALNEHTVSVAAQPAAGGSVGGGGSYTHFSQVTVTANPSTGYHFVHWTEGGSVISTEAAYTFTVTGPRALTAHFEPVPTDDHVISVTVVPAGAGTVLGDGEYAEGATAALSAQSAAGYLFGAWLENGLVVSIDPAYSFTVSGDRNLVARFAADVRPPTAPTWTGHLTSYRGQDFQLFRFTVTGTSVGSVWGTDLYTDDSVVAKAAVHAGLLGVGETTEVTVMILPGAASYASTTRHGITTSPWASWPGSYKFVDAVPASDHVLTYLAGAGGSLVGQATQYVDTGSDGTPVYAEADAGAVFVGWSDGSTANPREDLGVVSSLTLRALFRSHGGVDLDWYAEHGITPDAGQSWTDLDSLDPFARQQTLRQSFILGIDPRDPASRFSPEVHRQAGLVRLTFPSLERRVYRIWESADLEAWTLADVAHGHGDAWMHERPVAGGEAVFFRLEVDLVSETDGPDLPLVRFMEALPVDLSQYPDAPHPFGFSYVRALSEDGLVAAGSTGAYGHRFGAAAVWTVDEGLALLPNLNGTPVALDGSFIVSDASADGSRLIGRSRYFVGSWSLEDSEATIWDRQADGSWVPTGLGTISGAPYVLSRAVAGSSDGSVVYGFALGADYFNKPFRWTEAEGLVQLGIPAGMSSGYPTGRGASADGSLFIGGGEIYDANRNLLSGHAIVWENGDSGTVLPVPSWSFYAQAEGISANGCTIYGYASDADYTQSALLRWRRDAGGPWTLQNLGHPYGEGNPFRILFGVEASGEAVVFASYDWATNRWVGWLHNAHGFSPLDAVLPDVPELAGKQIQPAGISANGRFLFGAAIHEDGRGEGVVVDLGLETLLNAKTSLSEPALARVGSLPVDPVLYPEFPYSFSDSQFRYLSEDGSVAAGAAGVEWGGLGTPIVWTPQDGFQELPHPGGLPSSLAGVFLVSDGTPDGSRLVGRSRNDPDPVGLLRPEATVWDRQPDGSWLPTPLGTVPGAGSVNSRAVAVSNDGSIVYGFAAGPNGLFQPFRWTQSEGMTQLTMPPGYQIGLVSGRGTSADGSVAVGFGDAFDEEWEYLQTSAMVWRDGGPGEALPGPGWASLVSAEGISPDGGVIYGRAWTGQEGMWQSSLMRWTLDLTGNWEAEELGSPLGVGGSMNILIGVSEDGSLAAFSHHDWVNNEWVSWVRNEHGFLPIDSLVPASGLALGESFSVAGMTANARFLFGSVRSEYGPNEAAILEVPPGYLADAINSPPPNDAFADAVVLSGTWGSHSGSILGASREVGEPEPVAGASGLSVWYAWTAPHEDLVMFDTYGSNFRNLVAVYTGDELDQLQPVAVESGTLADPFAWVAFEAEAGVTYRILVDGMHKAGDALTLSWNYLLESVELETAHFEATGGTASLTITTHGYWELVGLPDWIIPSQLSGEGSGEVILTLLPHEGEEPRSAEFYLEGELIVITQAGVVTSGVDMVLVEGGTLSTTNELDGTEVATFYIGRYEVTWGEWQEVRAWAASRGYDIGNIGAGCADDHPVHSVNWYDVLKWCNALSEMEGLTPVYAVEGEVYRSGEFGWDGSHVVDQNLSADGYRLPLEAEWEFAARGGNWTNGYTYSGSNDLDAVGLYWWNSGGAACNMWSGRGTWPVGQKAANELGLYDMSGNVWEWCWDRASDNSFNPVLRGGSWNDYATSCTVSNGYSFGPAHRIYAFGFRLARSSGDGPAIAIIDLIGDLHFGDVPVGQSATRTLTVSNTGNAPLTVSGITYPVGFSGDWSGTVPAQASEEVSVTFTPLADQSYGGHITVSSNAGSGLNTREISGTGVPSGDPPPLGDMVLVEGGTLSTTNELDGTEVATFYIGRYEVTWGEWQEVRAWAASRGYDIGNIGAGCADDHPVHSVNWYDVLKWCNALSEMEGLTPVYSLGGLVYRSGEPDPLAISPDLSANGYRLPIEAEWEFAARGGIYSQGYTYAGGDVLDAVGWYRDNSAGALCDLWNGSGTWPVGQKAPNELGLYDMSGNVWEWSWGIWERPLETVVRLRSGSFIFSHLLAAVDYRTSYLPEDSRIDLGFRLARSFSTEHGAMVLVEGGTLSTITALDGTEVATFYIGRYEVTWGEWQAVRAWAALGGYDIGEIGAGCADDHPVHSVNWFDVLKWSNAKSEMEGLTPVYTVSGAVYRTGQPDHTTISQNLSANGYRLPLEAEWEFAARGGNQTNGFTYAGSNDLNAVGWYWDNSEGGVCDLWNGRGTWLVGQKAANELGLYDMSGNVWEWCWDLFFEPEDNVRRIRGGSSQTAAHMCVVSYAHLNSVGRRTIDLGFRLARSADPADAPPIQGTLLLQNADFSNGTDPW